MLAELVGGHVALDLVNTVSWRLDPARTVDRIADFDALLDWAAHAGVLEAPPPRRDPTADRRALHRVRRLREALHAVLADGPADVAVLRPFLLDALRHADLAPGLPLRWTAPVEAPDDLGHRLALAALELLSDAGLVARVRCCAGPGCGWLFIDGSRSHTRRWCSSSDCGNRERVRRHYGRIRAVAQKRAGSR